MASRPEVRLAIMEQLQLGAVCADSIEELQERFNLTHVSKSQFRDALGSLHVKRGLIKIHRPGRQSLHDSDFDRPFTVSLVRRE